MTVIPTAPPEAAPAARKTTAAPAFRGRLLPWLFLAPTLAVLALFLYLPAAQTLSLSTYRSNIVLGTRHAMLQKERSGAVHR